MILLLKGVTVLLLTTFTACDTSLYSGALTLLEKCEVNLTVKCVRDFLSQIQNITDRDLSQKDVESYLNTIMNLTNHMINNSADQTDQRFFANDLLNISEKLVSTLVNKTYTYSNISFSVQNLEVYVFMVGPNITLTKIPTLVTSYVSLVIDLIGISKDTAGSAALVFMSYTNMTDIFKPSFFDTNIISKKRLMSAVVSFSLPKTKNTWILEIIDFTIKHIKELDPKAILSCMNWETKYWPSCFVSKTNSTHTMCSCYYGTAFALISETEPCMNDSNEYCKEDFLFRMLDYIYSIEQLPQETVENYLTTTMNLLQQSASEYYGELLLYVNEILVSKLVKETDTYYFTSISLQILEVQVLVVGPDVTLSKTPTLITEYASLDIDLIGISEENRASGSMSVAFMTYTTLADILQPRFFDKFIQSHKTIMSKVVSATTTSNFDLIKPVNFTLKHVNESDPEGILFCAHRNWFAWDTGHCTITQTNNTHTVCSCNQLETLALFMLTIPCKDNVTAQCAKTFLDEISYNTAQDLQQELVTVYLNRTISLMSHVKGVVSEQNDLISFGTSVLEVTEKLASTLMEKTNTNISLQNLELFVVVNLTKIPTLITSYASLDINLPGISQNDQVSGSVAFVSYTNMSDIFKPTFFKTIINTKKTMMSPVVSVFVSQTTKKTQLTKSVNFTFKHTNVLEPEFSLSCVYWKKTEWVEDGCDVIPTNSSHTVCSCNQLGTFALIMETDPCRANLTEPCTKNFLKQTQFNTAQELPQKVVERYLNFTINLMTRVKKNTTVQDNLPYYGNAVLDLNEKLVSTLVKKTGNYINFTVQNIEVLVSMVVEPVVTINSISQLKTSKASMDIDLIGISQNNKGSAAVAFMSYTDMKDILLTTNTRKIISTVVSATLPKTPNTWFTQPVNITFEHISELDNEAKLSCVYWVENKWVEIGCARIPINSTHTMCSCDHLSVFALSIEIIPCKTLFGVTVSLHCHSVLNMSFAQGVGVVFLSLCLLTFAFCCHNTNETNTALINLCLFLLLSHLLDLLKPLFQLHLRPLQACAIMNGIRWFFFISAFVWMFIETVLLFLFLKNVSQIRSNLGQGIRWKWINMFGYLIPMVVVIVCAVVNPQNSINEECWGTKDIDMIFDIPVLFIVASNVLLYIIIIIMMIFTLKNLRNQNLQRHDTHNTDLIMRVMFKSLAQFIILGCYWILLYIPNDGVLYNVFLFLNSQQGTFIFIVHCLLNQEVRQQYRKFLCDICCFKTLGTTTEVEETRETQH